MNLCWREHKAGLILVLDPGQGEELTVGTIRRTRTGYDALAQSPGYDPSRARRGIGGLEEAKAFVESFRPWELHVGATDVEVEPKVHPAPSEQPHTRASVEPNASHDRGGVAMTTLYQTQHDSKTLEVEETTRPDTPFRLLITLKKLGVVTMLDYFLSPEEAQGIARAFMKSGTPAE